MRAILILIISMNIALDVNAQIKEYIYPNNKNPSMSNYGTTGLIMMPTARLYPDCLLYTSPSPRD